ncbi:zf-RING-2 multi-domain protein [Pyrenophora teres f. teres]|nr:zf-RING-2 multi-domain protein [Pyrenophora teres f. teres]
MNNTASNRTTRPAPAIVAAPMTATATAFISNNTVHDTTLSPTDECPICLDNYTEELCLRITGIVGCTHRVGANCLKEMLRGSPRTEKRCPLCRAVWIPRANRRMQLHSLNETTDANTSSRLPALYRRRVDLLAIHARRPRPRPDPLHNPVIPVRVPHAPMVIDSDSNSGNFATEVQNFRDFARDVADIRDRAQNTRGRRHRHRSVGIAVNQNTGDTSNESNNGLGRSNTSGGRGSGGNGNGNGTLNRIMNTGRNFNPFRPPTNDTSPRTNPTADSQTLPTLPEQSFDPLDVPSLPSGTRESSRTVPPATSSPVFHPISSPSPAHLIPCITSPSRFPRHSNPAASPTPNRDVDMSDANDLASHRLPTQSNSSSRRNDDITHREQMLDRREETLLALEVTLNAQQDVLARREAACRQRERDTEVMRMDLQRRRTELVEMLRRQREEVDRLVGS